MKRSVCVVTMLLCAHLVGAQVIKAPAPRAELKFSTIREESVLAAARENNLSQLQEILKNPSSIGAVNGMDSASNQLRTPLMYAAMHTNVPMARALLKRGAQATINQTDMRGNTALAYAVAFNSKHKNPQARLAMINLLLDAGADVNINYTKDSHSETNRELIQWALWTDDSDVVAALVDRGIKFDKFHVIYARDAQMFEAFQAFLRSPNMPWDNYGAMCQILFALRDKWHEEKDVAFPFVKAFLEAYQKTGRKASELIEAYVPGADPGDYEYYSDIPRIHEFTMEGAKIRAYYDQLVAEGK